MTTLQSSRSLLFLIETDYCFYTQLKLGTSLRLVIISTFIQLARIGRVCSAALLLWATAALAQEMPSPASEPKDTKPHAVSVEDVSQQAVRTATLLETLVPSEESYAALGEIATETDRLLKDVDERLTLMTRELVR